MRRLRLAATALALATCLLAPGVTARPGAQAPEPQAPGGQPTFRAGTRLATFDAVVTDDKGRHVTDLTPADFEVVERGKRQTVRQVAYVHAVRPDGAPTADAPRRGRAGCADDRHAGSAGAAVARADRPRDGDRRRRPAHVVPQHGRRADHAEPLRRPAAPAGRSGRDHPDRGRRRRAAAVHHRSPAAQGGHRPRPVVGAGLAVQSVRPLGGQRRGAGRSLRARGHAGRARSAPWRTPCAASRRLPGRKTVVFVSEGFAPRHARRPR